MPPWLSNVRDFQKKEENSHSSSWVQLATMGLDNTPRVRTVVFRGWSYSYEMKILTDKRSKKFQELESNNHVEVCWLFPKSKCQFRFRGTSTIDSSKDTLSHWKQLDDEAKPMWCWPNPGELFVQANEKICFDKRDVMSDNFTLLKIEIINVDQLLLLKPIHIRKRWKKTNNWIEERINP